MKELVLDWLLEGRRSQGALPSVREIARRVGASPQTVQKAIATLAARGVVHVLPRKGAFWGEVPQPEPRGMLRNPAWLDARERFLADLRQGAYHPHRPLPSRKELASIYGLSQRRLASIADELVDRGVLVRKGRGLGLPPPLVRAGTSTVLVVVRCDPAGRILLESEREIDFVKSVRREARERDLRVVMAGYHESEPGGGRLLDPKGRPMRPGADGGVLLGCILSTWLLRDPTAAIRSLREAAVPIAVWWEHARGAFPRTGSRSSPLRGYDLSFGKAPGIEVGRRLAADGHREIAFLSPYHDNEWSRQRLLGIREAMEAEGGRVTEIVDTGFQSLWHMERVAGGKSAGRQLLRRVLSRFLEHPGLEGIPAWVAVNDLAAAEILDLAAARGIETPRIVAFDGTSLGESLRFDSFEFHTDGMVRRMFHHILHPELADPASREVEEMVGRLVLRG